MTSVQDYLRNLRAARKEFVSRAATDTSPSVAAPAAAVSPAAVASPWLKSPAVPQPASSALQSDLGRGEPASARRGGGVRPAGGQRTPAEDSDSDTDISHLIDQLSLRSTPKPPAAGTAPRRGSKMDMLRRKFSTSSPTKSWADLGSSGGSLSRARARSRSSVSIRDEKIILSGISGDEDSPGSSSGTSSSSLIRTETAPGGRRSASSGEVPEQLDASGAGSSAPTVPSTSSVRTETEPTAASVETEEPTEESVSEEVAASAESKLARTARSVESASESQSDTESESDSESSASSADSQREPPDASGGAAPAHVSPAAAGTASLWAREGGSGRVAGRLRGRADPDSGRADRLRGRADSDSGRADRLRGRADSDSCRADRLPGRADPDSGRADRLVTKARDETGRSSRRPSKQHRRVQARRDRSSDDRRSDGANPRSRERRAKRTSKHREETRSTRDSRSHRRAKPSKEVEKTTTKPVSPSGRRRRRRRADRDWDASWRDVERTDASESLVVSYQRRVERSSGCCHCRRQAWPPPPPPPPVTVVMPPAAVPGGSGMVRFSPAVSGAVFADVEEDAVMSAMLTQQIALTRHFLATQKHLHQMYSRALRQTQRQVYTHRDDIKGSGQRRRGSSDVTGD